MVVPMSMGLASSLSISSRGFWPPGVYVWIVFGTYGRIGNWVGDPSHLYIPIIRCTGLCLQERGSGSCVRRFERVGDGIDLEIECS